MASNKISAWWEDAPTDSGVERIVSSIKRAEGAGYETPGASGESGAYQYKPDTWKKWSTGYTKETLGKPEVLPMTAQNQDNVTRFAVKSLLAEGHSPEQIFSIWNSGQPDWRGKVGVNSAGVKYDTPAYVQKAKSFYDKIKDVFAPSEAHAAEVTTNKPPIVWPDDLGAQSAAPQVQAAPANPMVPPAAGAESPAPTPAATSRPPIVWPDDLGIIQAEKDKAPSGMPDRAPPIASPEAITLPQWWMAERAQKPETRLKYLASKVFPTMPPEEGMKRFSMQDGEYYYTDMDQRVYKLSVEGEKATKILTPFASPGMIGGMVGGGIGAFVGAPNVGMILGSGAGGLADTYIAEHALGEPHTTTDYLKSAGKEMAVATLGVGGAKTLTGTANVVMSKSAGPLVKSLLRDPTFSWTTAEVLELQRVALQEFGIDLTLPELTGSPTLIRMMNSLSRKPGKPAELFRDYMEGPAGRKAKIMNSIETEIRAIHPDASIFNLSKAGSEAASSVLDDMRLERAGQVGPKFEQARKDNPDVDTTPIMDYLDKQLTEVHPKGTKAPVLKHIRELFSTEREVIDPATGAAALDAAGKPIMETVPETSLKMLDETKHELNKLIGKKPASDPKTGQPFAIDKELKAEITGIKNSLVDILERAHPKYAEGMNDFRVMSRDIDRFLWGVENVDLKRKYRSTILSAVEQLNSEDVVRAPSLLFGKNSSPEAVQLAKDYIVNRYPASMDPIKALEQRRGWDALVAAHLRETLQGVRSEQNVGWAFRKALFGNMETGSQKREMMKVAMGPDLYARWDKFATILDKTSRIIYQNSETAGMLAADKVAEKNLGNPLFEWMRGGVLSPIKQAGEYLGDRALAGNTEKLMQAMMDPGAVAVLEHLRKLPNTWRKAFETVGILGAIYTGESMTGISSKYFSGGEKAPGPIRSVPERTSQPQPQIWQSETGAVPGSQSSAPRVPVRTGRDRATGRIVHDYGNGVIEYAA